MLNREVRIMNEATQVLRQEHEVILGVLDATNNIAESLESGSDVSPQILSDIVEFLRLFADRQHHGKEEDLLFPELEKQGMPRDGGPVGMMLMEHQFGRSLIARMAEAGKAYESGSRDAGAQWADAAFDYVSLLRDHIAKENNILFVMAERILIPADQQRLLLSFQGVDKEKIGKAEGERLLALEENIQEQANALAKS
jgi:hemerythrin-like domain-containing protein